jgi:hypothetical protein
VTEPQLTRGIDLCKLHFLASDGTLSGFEWIVASDSDVLKRDEEKKIGICSTSISTSHCTNANSIK